MIKGFNIWSIWLKNGATTQPEPQQMYPTIPNMSLSWTVLLLNIKSWNTETERHASTKANAQRFVQRAFYKNFTVSVLGAKAEVTVTNIITPHAIELLRMDIMDVRLISEEVDA